MWNTSFCCDWLAPWASDVFPNLFSYIGANWNGGAPAATYCIDTGVTMSSIYELNSKTKQPL